MLNPFCPFENRMKLQNLYTCVQDVIHICTFMRFKQLLKLYFLLRNIILSTIIVLLYEA